MLALCLAFLTINRASAADNHEIAPATAYTKLLVNAVTFSGNRAFSNEQLSAAIQADLGRQMSLEDIKALAAKVELHYRNAGYALVKVVVPVQDFAPAKAVELVVLEGWLGSLQVRGAQRFPTVQVEQAFLAESVAQGKPFTLGAAERALTRLNRLSGIQVTSTLRPGEELGSTDVLVDVTESPRVQGAIEMNNYGNSSSGAYRVVPQLKFANLTGRGDEANIMGMTSLGHGALWFGYLDYSLPVNAYGTKARAYYARGNVDLGGAYQVLEIEGDNTTWGLGLSHDVVRSERDVLTVETWLESQDLQQRILGVLQAEDKIRKLRVGLTWDRADLYGRTLAAVGLQYGLGDGLGGMSDSSQMSSRSGVQADNRFTKLTFELSRLQQLAPRWLLIPRVAGQYASRSLVASEQWGIGGFNSVSGHAPSTFAGDQGYTASVEGRYALLKDSNRYQATARLEHGQVWLKQGLVGQDTNPHLTGMTVGLLARPIDRLEMRIDLGKPIGGRTEKKAYLYAKLRYHF